MKKNKKNTEFACLLMLSSMVAFITAINVSLITDINVHSNINDESKMTSPESVIITDQETIISSSNTSTEVHTTVTKAVSVCRNLSKEDKYLLAKIAMAEAEGESIETKMLVMLTILNRVESDEAYFPDTISEVIFQVSQDGTYQFTPLMPNGRWWTVEPNEECWNAVELINFTTNDMSNGALYFEACSGESWHSENLEFICQSDNTRFYK